VAAATVAVAIYVQKNVPPVARPAAAASNVSARVTAA
jgi:hypothetical protein